MAKGSGKGGRSTVKGSGFKNGAVKGKGAAPSAKATKGTSKGGLPTGLTRSR